jgi:hypothetical protein
MTITSKSRAMAALFLIGASVQWVMIAPAAGQDVHLLYRGIQPQTIPETAIDQSGRPFRIAGLSGITWAGGNTFWAVMDNSDKLVCFEMRFKDDCSIRSAKVAGGLTLSEPHDYEGIVFTPRNSVYVSEEDSPGIHEFGLADGGKMGSLPIPDVFLHGHTIRNQGFESLTMRPDGSEIWTANERALTIDGNTKLLAEPMGARTRVRLLRFVVKGSEIRPAEQYVYQTSGVHDLAGQIGLSDLVALRDGRLLALERSGARSIEGKNSIRTRIFLVDVRGETDVSGPPYDSGLVNQTPTPVTKTELYDGFIFDDDGENLEGLCLGPQIGKGRWIVLGIVDDSDYLGVSKNRLVAFELLMGQ